METTLPDGSIGYDYTPSLNDPGFWSSTDFSGVTYHIVSDRQPDPVPEPATLGIFSVGLAGFGWMRRRRKVA